MTRGKKREFDPADLLGGTLNILGLKFDLQELLSSPEQLQDRLAQLRERLKAAGGKETLSDEEWRRGGVTITGSIRTRGLLGDREFHIGTFGGRERTGAEKAAAPAPPAEPVEPPVDVFDEDGEIAIIADVPGVSLEDLDLTVEGRTFTLQTRANARRAYRKQVALSTDVDEGSLRSSCNNGVLEVRLSKRGRS